MCRKSKEVPPSKRRGDIIAWLLGYNSSNWAHSLDEFEAKYAKHSVKSIYTSSDYCEWEIRGESFIFARCKCGDEMHKNISCFISDAISKSEILKLVPEMTQKQDITEKILAANFGVTHEQFQAAWEVVS